MKKLSLCLLFLLMLPLTAMAEDLTPPPGVWKNGRAEIMALYDSKPVRNNDYLTYNIAPVFGMEAQINYGFTKDDELAFMSYRLYANPASATMHLEHYDDVKQQLKAEYGRPVSDNIYWFGDKATPQAEKNIGVALAQRAVRFVTRWELRETRLELDMKGQGEKVVISVMYTSDEFGKKFFDGVQNR